LLHEFEDECQFACVSESIVTGWFVVQYFDQLDHVVVGGQQFEGLDLFEFLHFFNCLKLFLHALDRHVLASFERVSHEHFGKGAVAALGFQSILFHERLKASKDQL
jgi:hypothetical protein